MANPFKLIRDAVAGPPGPQAMDEYVPGVDPNMDRLMRRGAYQVAGNGERGTYSPASFEDINRQQNSPPVPNAPWVPQQQAVAPTVMAPNLGEPPLDYRGVAQANTQINAPAMLPPTAHQPITDPYEQYAQAMHGQANQAYEKHLQQFPQYQSPGIFNKIVAGLGGASAGYFGGAGEGLKVGQGYLNAPYQQQVSRWQQQNAPLAQAAGIEAREAGHLLDPMRLYLQQQKQAEIERHNLSGEKTAGAKVETGKAQQKTREEALALRRTQAGYNEDLDPLSDEELSLYQKAQIDTTVASAALKRAQAEYEKTRNDPNSPAFKLAAARLSEAQRGHDIATKKADTFAELINLRKYGMTGPTLGQGEPVPGVALTPGGTPIGTNLPGSKAQELTGQDKNRRTAAELITAVAPDLSRKIERWKNLFGTFKGNRNKIDLALRREGINLADINQGMETIVQTVAPLHGRNTAQAVADYRRALPTLANDPKAALQYYKSLVDFSKKVIAVTGDRFYTGPQFDYAGGDKPYNELKKKHPPSAIAPPANEDQDKYLNSIIDEATQ